MSRATVLGVVFGALGVSASMSGCLWCDIALPDVYFAEWHQPGLIEMFPPVGEFGEFEILDDGKYAIRGKVAIHKWRTSSLILTVSDLGDVRFRGLTCPASWSSAETWMHLRDVFDALALPEPTLNPAFEFAEVDRQFRGSVVWQQPELWSEFPEGDAGAFRTYAGSDLKVAERIDRSTSEWVRVTEDGNVSFRFEGRYLDAPRLDSTDQTQAWRVGVQARIASAFELLGLPAPHFAEGFELEDAWDFWERH